MSRLAKKPVKLPEGVSLLRDGDVLVVKGPKGEKKIAIFPGIKTETKDGGVLVESEARSRKDRQLLGTYWALIRNAIQGVKEGFSKILEIEGVGYKAALEGNELVLHLGYAAPVRIALPSGVAVDVDKNTIKVSGVDKELVGQFAADVRSFKKPEPYKGKGIRYRGEVVRRKVGKKAAAAAA